MFNLPSSVSNHQADKLYTARPQLVFLPEIEVKGTFSQQQQQQQQRQREQKVKKKKSISLNSSINIMANLTGGGRADQEKKVKGQTNGKDGIKTDKYKLDSGY